MNAPPDAVCIEDGCTLDAVTTRPTTEDWLMGSGVIPAGEADEWVCAVHA